SGGSGRPGDQRGGVAFPGGRPGDHRQVRGNGDPSGRGDLHHPPAAGRAGQGQGLITRPHRGAGVGGPAGKLARGDPKGGPKGGATVERHVAGGWAGAAGEPASRPESHLAVRGLVKTFGATQVLHGVTFQVARGEIVAILGPNGAGKTTTLKTIAGLLRPTAGQVWVAGRPHTHPEARRALALVPEVPAVYELLTTWEHLEFIARAFALDGWQPEAEALLRRYHLWEKRDALVGLDPAAQRDLKDTLRALRDQGAAILVSTHMLETAERLCDRALVLHRGRVIAEGGLDALRAQFRLAGDASLEDIFLEATG